jgi:coenzyme F420-reducing hydrogenase beta subunit
VKAIDLVEDSKGFLYPVIYEDKCISCGRCLKACQLYKGKTDHDIKASYALQINEKSILETSSSGGAFSALAIAIFRDNGVVYGCMFNDEAVAIYQRATSIEEIVPMRGSKYVWANASACFKSVLNDLNAGTRVLFCGLPCQVAGLYYYLGKEYEKLLTMDFLCGGAPSPKVFKAYIDSFVKETEKKYLNYKFRDKEKNKNGTGYGISYVIGGKKKHRITELDSYMYLFSNKLIQRESCYECEYRGIHRIPDITVGDYWGVNRIFPELDYRSGISFIIANTDKGLQIIKEIQSICLLKETNIADIAKRNIIRPDNSVKKIPIPENREKFFVALNKYGYRGAVLRYTITIKRIKLIIVKMLNLKR